MSHRADERFAMCSTFKWALVAAVLAEVDAGRVQLAQRVALSERDLLEYAPTTRAHVGSGAMKTGTCERCAVHDVAVVWPPGRAPLVIAAYLSDGASPLVDLKRAHAAIARHVVEELR